MASNKNSLYQLKIWKCIAFVTFFSYFPQRVESAGMYHTGPDPYVPHEYELFVPKIPLNIGNETVLSFFLHFGELDMDLKYYIPSRLTDIINCYKQKIYDMVSREGLRSNDRDKEYEFFSRTNRMILQGINEWYLNLHHVVKINTIMELKHDFFGADNYTFVGTEYMFDHCPEKDRLPEFWEQIDVFRESLANLTAPLREKIRLQILKQTLKPYQFWHDKKRKNRTDLIYSIEKIENYGLPKSYQ